MSCQGKLSQMDYIRGQLCRDSITHQATGALLPSRISLQMHIKSIKNKEQKTKQTEQKDRTCSNYIKVATVSHPLMNN